uniref:OSJNBa0019K04.17 protein n=1 Tax=Oryza sativa subsp. japonica TaxID=39947 RepID=Q7XTY0_ORYSJ|nr:OSJNBa0019K04.17 [Oryza sativa Japonica Group]
MAARPFSACSLPQRCSVLLRLLPRPPRPPLPRPRPTSASTTGRRLVRNRLRDRPPPLVVSSRSLSLGSAAAPPWRPPVPPPPAPTPGAAPSSSACSLHLRDCRRHIRDRCRLVRIRLRDRPSSRPRSTVVARPRSSLRDWLPLVYASHRLVHDRRIDSISHVRECTPFSSTSISIAAMVIPSRRVRAHSLGEYASLILHREEEANQAFGSASCNCLFVLEYDNIDYILFIMSSTYSEKATRRPLRSCGAVLRTPLKSAIVAQPWCSVDGGMQPRDLRHSSEEASGDDGAGEAVSRCRREGVVAEPRRSLRGDQVGMWELQAVASTRSYYFLVAFAASALAPAGAGDDGQHVASRRTRTIAPSGAAMYSRDKYRGESAMAAWQEAYRAGPGWRGTCFC